MVLSKNSIKILTNTIKNQPDLVTEKYSFNNYLFLSKYVQLIKNKIKNKLNPLKKNLTYLSQLSVSVSKKPLKKFHLSSKINMIEPLLKKNNFSNKYEKNFLSYLSLIKTRKTKYELVKKKMLK